MNLLCGTRNVVKTAFINQFYLKTIDIFLLEVNNKLNATRIVYQNMFTQN